MGTRGPGQAEGAVGLPGRAKQGLVGALQSCLRRSGVCLGRKAPEEEVMEGQAVPQEHGGSLSGPVHGVAD